MSANTSLATSRRAVVRADLRLQPEVARRDLEVGWRLREGMTERQRRAQQRGAGKCRVAETAAGEPSAIGHGSLPDFLAGL
jgi:hypothetical protein